MAHRGWTHVVTITARWGSENMDNEIKELLRDGNELRCRVAQLEANNRDLKTLTVLLSIAILVMVVVKML